MLGDHEGEEEEEDTGPERELVKRLANTQMYSLKVRIISSYTVYYCFPEKKILPALVLVFSLVYVIIAILFYFRYV